MSIVIRESHANNSTPLWVPAGGSGAGILPAGMVMQWSSFLVAIPKGWLPCDGSAVSRTTYAELFSLIGATYGPGDGVTTFNIPNFQGRVVRGVDAGGVSYPLGGTGGANSLVIGAPNLPVHTHSITDPGHSHDVVLSGMYNNGDNGSAIVYAGQDISGGAGSRTSDPNAAVSTTTGITETNANVTTNDPIDIRDPYLAMHYIIKYTSANL